MSRETSVLAKRIDRLRAIFPEAFSEDKVDFEKLRATLGDFVDTGPERYRFAWAGRTASIRTSESPSKATLTPSRHESIGFDETKNVFIEGENLEVLKILQKAYEGSIKMIYVDPPYNTGNDRIYVDDYADPLGRYLQMTGQADAKGDLLTSNPETSGRFHSTWLSMMFPRLFLAWELLGDDGVMFITIDDTEVANLRQLMNEVFGEENFIAAVTWQKKVSPSNDAKWFSSDHDYVLVYAKSKQTWRPKRLRRTEAQKRYYKNPDNDTRGPWNSATYTCNKSKSERPNLYYQITNPNTGKKIWPRKTAVWKYSEEEHEENARKKLVYWGKDGKASMPRFKLFLENMRDVVPRTVWSYSEVGHTQEATEEFQKIMPEGGFDTPKPVRLVKRMLELSTDSGPEPQIILDFFAGSCTTAQAVLEQNRADGGNRKFIMVQLQEPTPEDSLIRKAGFNTISAIGKERIRRVIASMKRDRDKSVMRDRPEDLGFKVFKLARSNCFIWDPEEATESETLARHIEKSAKGANRTESESLVFELMLRQGLRLDSQIERIRKDNNEFYKVSDDKHALWICLDEAIDPVAVKSLGLTKDDKLIVPDDSLTDTQKINLSMIVRIETV